jgi:aldehyde:ferredoxin oxidoreductase
LHGYHAQHLRVDVGTGRTESLPIDPIALRRYVGGVGLGAYLALKAGAAGIDPLRPPAPLSFVFSPLVGSPLTTSAKFAVVSRSPLTGRFNDALASSGFAVAGKQTGHDAITLVGRAYEPVIVVVDNADVRIEPAADVWGLDCFSAEARLKERLGRDYSIAVIGPAGERLVRYATISHDGRHAGRGGSGAVLGAKNVKAIAVRGEHRTMSSDPKGVAAFAKVLSARSLGPATAKYRELGTVSNLRVFNRLGVLPTRNFQSGSFDGAESLAPDGEIAIGNAPNGNATVERKVRKHCMACTIGCEHIYSVRGGKSDNGKSARLEYENLFALGSLCGVGDTSAVVAASRRCDELGIDAISAGGTLAFAMECVERGWLEAKWLRFGDADAVRRGIEMIGARDGLGDLLAEGSRKAAGRIGHGAAEIAPHVKGLEMPGYEPRGMQTMALGFAVGARGADHNRSGGYEVDFSDAVDRRAVDDSAVAHLIDKEDRAAVMDSLILCKFIRGVFDDYYDEAAEILRLVTGWDVTAEELRLSAQRIVSAKKWFNILSGWQPAEDTLPGRFFREAPENDPRAVLTRDRLQELVTAYNQSRGWSPEGWMDEAARMRWGLAECGTATPIEEFAESESALSESATA